MDRYEEYEAGDESAEFYFSLVPDEERRRSWSERGWSDQPEEVLLAGPVLFADQEDELELRREIRLSELWQHCDGGCFTLDEFRELSTLITQVDVIRGALCVDCAMLDRPSVSANWSLADTSLCRGHLRFRLAHAHIDGGGPDRIA